MVNSSSLKLWQRLADFLPRPLGGEGRGEGVSGVNPKIILIVTVNRPTQSWFLQEFATLGDN
jgi:hypothetical protein